MVVKFLKVTRNPLSTGIAEQVRCLRIILKPHKDIECFGIKFIMEFITTDHICKNQSKSHTMQSQILLFNNSWVHHKLKLIIQAIIAVRFHKSALGCQISYNYADN